MINSDSDTIDFKQVENERNTNQSHGNDNIDLPSIQPIKFTDIKNALLELANEPLDDTFSNASDSDELERSFFERSELKESEFQASEEQPGEEEILNTSFLQENDSVVNKDSKGADISSSNNEPVRTSSAWSSHSGSFQQILNRQENKFDTHNDTKGADISSSNKEPVNTSSAWSSHSGSFQQILNRQENKFDTHNDSNRTNSSILDTVELITSAVKQSYISEKLCTPASSTGKHLTFKTPSLSSYMKGSTLHSSNFTPSTISTKKSSIELFNSAKRPTEIYYPDRPFGTHSISLSQYSANKTKPYHSFQETLRLEQENNMNRNNMKAVEFSCSRKELFENEFKTLVVKNVRYIILKQIGRGGSSTVYHCFDPLDQSESAIKVVQLIDDQAESYINEVKLLHDLQKCDRIVKMYEYELVNSENKLYVVLEKGDSDLAKILKNLAGKNDHLPLHMLLFYWMEMLLAVKQIHDHGIIHSDLKPANFLKVAGGLKLIDFGIASCIQVDCTSIIKDIARGSFNYISPESLNNEGSIDENSPYYGKPKYKISCKTDVWSLGCILYELVYKKTPFQHINNMYAKFNAILDSNHQIHYPPVTWAPPKILESIKDCLRYDMRSRPSIDELIKDCENILLK